MANSELTVCQFLNSMANSELTVCHVSARNPGIPALLTVCATAYNHPDMNDLTDEQQKAMNVDYDFCAALEYNSQDGWGLENVHKVRAVVEGERDESAWHWIVELTRMPKNKSFVYMTGSCYYTGWD
jgi:hypothetical protein